MINQKTIKAKNIDAHLKNELGDFSDLEPIANYIQIALKGVDSDGDLLIEVTFYQIQCP